MRTSKKTSGSRTVGSQHLHPARDGEYNGVFQWPEKRHAEATDRGSSGLLPQRRSRLHGAATQQAPNGSRVPLARTRGSPCHRARATRPRSRRSGRARAHTPFPRWHDAPAVHPRVTPEDWLARLAALVPRPRAHLTRCVLPSLGACSQPTTGGGAAPTIDTPAGTPLQSDTITAGSRRAGSRSCSTPAGTARPARPWSRRNAVAGKTARGCSRPLRLMRRGFSEVGRDNAMGFCIVLRLLLFCLLASARRVAACPRRRSTADRAASAQRPRRHPLKVLNSRRAAPPHARSGLVHRRAQSCSCRSSGCVSRQRGPRKRGLVGLLRRCAPTSSVLLWCVQRRVRRRHVGLTGGATPRVYVTPEDGSLKARTSRTESLYAH